MPDNKAKQAVTPILIDAGQRQQHIVTAAYFKAEAHGFAPGGELEDWLEAGREADTQRVSE